MISTPSTMLFPWQVHPSLGPGPHSSGVQAFGDIKLETPASTSLSSGKEAPSTTGTNGGSPKKPTRSSNPRSGRPPGAKTSPKKNEKARTASLLPHTRRRAVAAASTETHSFDEPEWTVAEPERDEIKTSDTSVPQPETSVRPRIWASSKRDLFLLIPELAKAVDGISWLSLETPVLILDSDHGWSKDGWNEHKTTFDLTMGRNFIFSQRWEAEHQSAVREGGTNPQQSAALGAEARQLFAPSKPESHWPEFTEPVPNNDVFHERHSFLPSNCAIGSTDISSAIISPNPSIPESRFALKRPSIDSAFPTCGWGPFELPCDSNHEKEETCFIPHMRPPSSHQVNRVTYPTSLERWTVGEGQSRPDSPLTSLDSSDGDPCEENSPRLSDPVPRRPLDLSILERMPQEIQALVDSYENSVPVIVIMSRDCPLSPVLPPPECVYSYLGLFRIIKSEVERSENSRHLPSKRILRNVTWRFKFSWASGGEDFFSKNGIQPLTPWWSPGAVEESAPPNDTNTYRWRDFEKSFLSLLPQDLLCPFRMTGSDYGFPRGWLCVDCGRLNVQNYLRHRKCSNCQDDLRPGMGYALNLNAVRDFQQQTWSFALPSDVYPDDMDSSAVVWLNEMRTFSYYVKPGVIVKHIYTCNNPALQEEPTSLFRDFQIFVPLVRQSNGSTPGIFFMYTVSEVPKEESRTVLWQDALLCVHRARAFMLHQGKWYGEDQGLSINRLTALAWVAAGRRKTIIEASASTTTILCLGSDVVLSIAPKIKGEPVLVRLPGVDLPSTKDFAIDDLSESSDVEVLDAIDIHDTPLPRPRRSAKQIDRLVVTLVHGDILTLSGSDFDCSMQRTGTSIVLFGSAE